MIEHEPNWVSTQEGVYGSGKPVGLVLAEGQYFICEGKAVVSGQARKHNILGHKQFAVDGGKG